MVHRRGVRVRRVGEKMRWREGKTTNLLHFLVEFAVLHFKCAQREL